MKNAIASVIVVALSVASLLAAAEFWQTKPHTSWTRKEVDAISSSSPWAQTVVLRKANMVEIRREVGKFATGAGEGEGTQNPEVNYAISLRTALPIREAIARAAALDQNYEQMDSSSKAQFDKKWGQFLAQQFPDKVIVNVKYTATATDVDRQLASYWQSQNLATVQVETYMNGPSGERVAPIAFWAGKGASREFQLAFPRPAVSPLKSSFSIEFKHPDVTEQPSSRIIGRFSVKDLQYKGQLTY
jgi:hypothetical protein